MPVNPTITHTLPALIACLVSLGMAALLELTKCWHGRWSMDHLNNAKGAF